MSPERPEDDSTGSPDEIPQQDALHSADDAQDVLKRSGRSKLTPVDAVTTTPPSGPPPVEEAGEGSHFKVLTSLISRTLFFDYFVHVASMRYSGKRTEPKVRQLIEDSRRLYRLVVAADLVLRGISVLLLLATISIVLWKTIIR